MKLALTFITIAGILFLLGLTGSFLFTDAGCGACPGVPPNPYLTMLIIGVPTITKLSQAACTISGCSIPKMPIFIDINGFAFILFAFGIFRSVTRK